MKMSPKPTCDDCIAEVLNLSSRQQANQETRLLAYALGFDKRRDACRRCGRVKLATRYIGTSGTASPQKTPLAQSTPSPQPRTTPTPFLRADAKFTKACATPERTLFLVSCVKTKGPKPAKAKDLYISPWFQKARACVEKTGCGWRVLSARYGLVDPEEEIHPYEQTLNHMGARERRQWAEQVLEDVMPCLEGIETVVFFAGKKYREYLCPVLLSRAVQVQIPMARLAQGKQLSWLNGCLRG